MTTQVIRIMCPRLTCRRILAVPVSSRGKHVRCRGCSATIRVPDGSAPAGAAAPAATDAAEPAAKTEDEKPSKKTKAA